MAVREYVGARYVPKFSEINGGVWDNTYSYEALEIVKHGNDYYTARKPVPVGADILDTTYWVLTGNYNGAIASLTSRVDALDLQMQDVDDFMDINKYFITPEDYGAVADGSTDCTAAIQQAIDENPDSPIYFNTGVYCISDTIEAKKGFHFFMAPNAEIKLTAAKNCMLYDNIADAQSDTSLRSYRTIIRGGIINANGNAQVAIGYNYCIGATFADINIMNFTQTGIYCGYNIDGASDVVSASNYHSNLYISKAIAPNDLSYGVRSDGADNFYNDITIVDCRYGMYLTQGGHKVYNVHPWIHAGNFAGSVGFYSRATSTFSNCTSDGMQTAVKIDTSGTWFVADNFRFAFHDIPDAEVAAAGGFTFFDVAAALSPTSFRVLMSNVIAFVTYTTGGVFVNDTIYNNKAVYDAFQIKNIKGTSALNSVANLLGDPENSDYLGAILPTGADLNDYNIAGKWVANNTALGNSILNKPTNADGYFAGGFTLIVERNASYSRQHFYGLTLTGVPTEAYRLITSSNQGPWITVGNP